MLPLRRIDIPDDPELQDQNKMWFNTEAGAYNFAERTRVAQLAQVFEPHWFQPGDDGVTCKFGLKAEYIVDAVQALKTWMSRRAGDNPNRDEEQEKMSWRKTLDFHKFAMTDKEIAELTATAIAVLHVRWQWISSWLLAERAKLPEGPASSNAAV